MHQETEKLLPQTQLSQIFPDIEGQLCSRHSTLFGKLKTSFAKLYDNLEPSHYVIVKGTSTIISTDQVSLSLALENGIILLVRKTYPQSKVFLNGNHIDEEIIFEENGKIAEGLHQWSEELQTTFETAIQDISIQKLCGGIIYIHSNIPESFFQYKDAMLIAFFLGIMIINDVFQEYSLNQILNKMKSTKVMGDDYFLEKHFKGYENRNFHLEVGQNSFKVPLESDLKLLVCRLDLAPQDIEYEKQMREKYKNVKTKILQYLEKKCRVSSFYEAFQEQISISQDEFMLEEDQHLVQEVINTEMKELAMLCQYSNHAVGFSELINLKWELDANQWKLYPQEVLELVNEIKKNASLQSCTIINSTFLLIPVSKRIFAEVIYKLRQLCHRGELKSKSLFKIEEQLLEKRWGGDQQIGEKIFASVPSRGVAVFDPTEAIWFD